MRVGDQFFELAIGCAFDFVEILEGVTLGEQVVSTGVFKLRNGQTAVVDNRLNPAFMTNPEPEDQ